MWCNWISMHRIGIVLLFACFFHVVHTAEEYPADICFMVADLKYNARQGIKICEIQQASLSLFNGDTFRMVQEESIYKELLRILSLYNKNGWVVMEGMADKNIVSTLMCSSGWKNPQDMIALLSDEYFMNCAKQSAANI